MHKINILFLSFLFLISCKKDEPDVIASFDYTSSNNFYPDTLAFSNTSQNAESYLWDFGDGTSSTEVNPTHIFTHSGEFKIILTATKGNESDMAAKKLIVNGPPTRFKIIKMQLEPDCAPLLALQWDSLDGPDLYFEIMDGSWSYTFYSSNNNIHYNTTQNELPLSWTLSPPAEDYISPMGGILHPLVIRVYDADAAGINQFIIGGHFHPDICTPPTGSYPSEVIINQNNNNMRLYLEWGW